MALELVSAHWGVRRLPENCGSFEPHLIAGGYHEFLFIDFVKTGAGLFRD